MQTTKTSQKRPMILWCLLVAALVAVLIAIGITMFNMPGRGTPVEQRSPAPASSQ